MKFIQPTKVELYSFLFSMPVISLVLNLILYNGRVWTDYRILVFSGPLIFLFGFVSWFMHVQYTGSVAKKYPELDQSRQRILRRALVTLLVMSPSVLMIFFVYHQFHIFGYHLLRQHLYSGLLTGFCVNIIFETLFEVDYVLRKYIESKTEKETLASLSVAQEFDGLKNQVNPHFLFNCFNTLSSLITVDKQKAELFLNELSKVYRYLLKNNEEGVNTVENEIRFIGSYFQLLQTRHGEAVQLHVRVDKQYEQYMLPSMTLQLLVENVVKHNALSKNKPLVIDIFTTTGNKLIVSNNIQRRKVKVPGNGVGLENIKAKYQLLRRTGFQIMEDEKNFIVVLPLIWNNAAVKQQAVTE